MNNQNSIVFNRIAPQTPQTSSVIRAKSFKVNSPNHNFAQYINTIKAYALAGLPFEHIANAGEYLGDPVERGELDAPLQDGWEQKVGETIEDESKILSWQNRGEIISVVPQLTSPNPVTGQEMVNTTQQITNNPPQEEQRNILEGIAVYNQLENNPFLKVLPQDIQTR